jgi:hypothetical protein
VVDLLQIDPASPGAVVRMRLGLEPGPGSPATTLRT